MITRFDDFPIHQTVDPIAYTATSDRFTYDRYWYNGHSRDGAVYFAVALGRYPNLGILDCGFSLVIDGRQYAFHASRRAPREPSETVVGPFSLQILEPMGRHRLRIEPNETGIECDLVFTPRSCAIEEGRQTKRNERHLIQDVTRFDQFGFWHGYIRCNGIELAVDASETFGLKDRSWGIRQVGERYTGGAPMQASHNVHFLWAPIHWRERCTLAGLYEDGDGYQWHSDQAIVTAGAVAQTIDPGDESGLTQWRGRVEHQLCFEPGTRRASSAQIRMQDRDGENIEIDLEPVALFRMKGIGYQHPEWGHGAWKGELAIGAESWDCDAPDPLAWENLHIQQLVVARCGDEVGYGVLEQMHIGPYAPYGLEGMFGGAPGADQPLP
ncbi:hypothetical protein E4634_09655 [Mangrovimicrobium sediminis]|uniref:AttH domain-containing protein n=1 Tax=Mangrovimicrobium sediminis TaxID=2562682 RepID=A0A4Z0M0T6_9GAMM|nr:hypothetical protein [Haliea sp. SAOS-164]TGD73293.1 hypothetical protein E4634_09655 [Haliea sp. SAOS-164]